MKDYSSNNQGGSMLGSVYKEIWSGIVEISNAFDYKWQHASPSAIVTGTLITVFVLKIFFSFIKPRYGESDNEMYGRWALKIPTIKQKFDKDIRITSKRIRTDYQIRWEKFGQLFTQIPEEGLGMKVITEMLNFYVKTTNDSLNKKHFSGLIYPSSLINTQKDIKKESQEVVKLDPLVINEKIDFQDTNYFTRVAKNLETIYVSVFKDTYLWNSQHIPEFDIGPFIDYQVVRMVANLFGAKKDEVTGSLTSGTTESLLLAARIYRDWGIKTHGHLPGESVIIAPDTIHMSLLKAVNAYHINVVTIQTDSCGNIDFGELTGELEVYGSQVVAIFGSAPCYSTGAVDPIEKLGELAKNVGCGLHVDCGSGAFLINYLDGFDSRFFQIPGVSSISVDMHKNGLAPRGSSVVILGKIGEKNLAYYTSHFMSESNVGTFSLTKDTGSSTCVNSLCTFFAMLLIGKEGYRSIAKSIFKTTGELAEVIRNNVGKLILLRNSQTNVVAFEIDKTWVYIEDSMTVLCEEMSKRGVTLNLIAYDKVNFCVTGRFAGDHEGVKKFEIALKGSLEILEKVSKKRKETELSSSKKLNLFEKITKMVVDQLPTWDFQEHVESRWLTENKSREEMKTIYLAQLDPYQKI